MVFLYFCFVLLLGKNMPHFTRIDKTFYSVFLPVLSSSYLQMLCCVALKGVKWWKRKYYLWINFLFQYLCHTATQHNIYHDVHVPGLALSCPWFTTSIPFTLLAPVWPLSSVTRGRGLDFHGGSCMWFPGWFRLLGLTLIVVVFFFCHRSLFNFLFWVNSLLRVTWIVTPVYCTAPTSFL